MLMPKTSYAIAVSAMGLPLSAPVKIFNLQHQIFIFSTKFVITVILSLLEYSTQVKIIDLSDVHLLNSSSYTCRCQP